MTPRHGNAVTTNGNNTTFDFGNGDREETATLTIIFSTTS